MIRLLIADDHALMREGLKRIFALMPDFEVAAEADGGSGVIECLRKESVDVVLLDLNMPGISGTDLIARIKAHRPNLPILILTMSNEPLLATRALKVGASGYITKDCEPEVLFAAIRKVAAQGHYITPELAEKMVFQVASEVQAAPHYQLTNRELEVFHYLIAGRSLSFIATDLSISYKTVSTHKTRLMEKLSVKSTVDLMRYAMINGLLDPTLGYQTVTM